MEYFGLSSTPGNLICILENYVHREPCVLYSVKEEIFPMIKIPQKSNLIINSLVPFQFIFTLDMLDYHFRTLSLSLES